MSPRAFLAVLLFATLGCLQPPEAPTHLVALALSPTAALLTWSDESKDELRFEVEQGRSADDFAFLGTAGQNATGFDVVSLLPEHDYFFRVRARGEGGDSAWSNVAWVKTPAPPAVPSAPTRAVAVALSQTQIRVTWVDTSDDETAFHLDRAPTPAGLWTQVGATAANVTTWDDLGVEPATLYFYRLHASNPGGASAPSNTAWARTPGATVPRAPSGLRAEATSASTAQLSWVDRSDDETGFKVERALALDGPFTLVAFVAANVTAFDDTGLRPLTTWWYRVRATNLAGDGDPSNVEALTTPAAE